MGPEARVCFVEAQLSNRADNDTNTPYPDCGGPDRRWKHSDFPAAVIGLWQCACALLDIVGSCSGPRVCRVCLSEEAFLRLNLSAHSFLATEAQL